MPPPTCETSLPNDDLRLEFVDRDARTTFEFSSDQQRRVRVGLRFPLGRSAIDVSVQPGLLADLARTHQAERDVADAVRKFAEGRGAWTTRRADASIEVLVGGAAFPLLGAAYDRGVGPMARIPRWLSGVVRCTSAREAAATAFGAKATRRLARALPSNLVGSAMGPPRVAGLGLAMATAPLLEPDELVMLLDAGYENDVVLSTDEVRRVRAVVASWGREKSRRLVGDAAGSVRKTGALVEVAQLWDGVGHLLGSRFPNRIDEVAAALRDLMPVDPGPAPRVVAPQPRPGPPARPAQRRAGARGTRRVPNEPVPFVPFDRPDQAAPHRPTPRRATTQREPAPEIGIRPDDEHDIYEPQTPPVAGGLTSHQPIERSPRLAAIDGLTIGPIRLCLPRTTVEVVSWGSRLDNCLASYAAAAVAQQSILIGIQVRDRLCYCVEITPQGTVRQFLGLRNRPPSAEHERVVLDALRAAHVVKSDPTGATP